MNSEPFCIDQKHLFNQMCLSHVDRKMKVYCLLGSILRLKLKLQFKKDLFFALYFLNSVFFVCDLTVFFKSNIKRNAS